MKKLTGRVSQKRGLPPGVMVHVGEKKLDDVKILVIEYNEKEYNICEVKSLAECKPAVKKPTVRWINVVGIHRVDAIAEVGSYFDIHPLVIEDVLNTNQRPKLDVWDEYSYIVLTILHFDDEKNEIIPEQVSVILFRDTVITFQETAGDDFIPVIDRVINAQGRIRRQGADFLACALLDSIVDNYFGVLEKLGERIEAIEDEVIANPQTETVNELHFLKREMIFLRKSVWPLREVIGSLERGQSPMVDENTLVYFKDIYDHVIQVIDTIELFRDMLSGMVDVYLSSINNKMNEVMKLLTIITTIFIPLSFIAGVYGMNFKFMPELEWPRGYFYVLAFMLAIALLMLGLFKRKKWL